MSSTELMPLSVTINLSEGACFFNSSVEADFNVFKGNMDIILANRMVAELEDVKEKVFTRDLFGTD